MCAILDLIGDFTCDDHDHMFSVLLKLQLLDSITAEYYLMDRHWNLLSVVDSLNYVGALIKVM